MKIAVLDDYQQVAESMADWSQLPRGAEIRFFQDHLTDEDQLVDRLKDYQVVMGMRERTAFRRSLMERLPELRLLITTGGRNAVFDEDAATELGIVLCGTGGQGEGATELTWGLIIGLLRQIPLEDKLTREGQWGTTIGVGLKGKTLGLVGLGHIGSLVAKVGDAFGMNLIGWSQNLTAQRAAECNTALVSKEDLFREADVVSIHLKLSERTTGLVGRPELQLMRPTGYLINTSRGPIVDESALVEALQNRSIAGAGLDTYDVEPLPKDHPFLQLPNTVLAPHQGYVTEDAYRAYYAGVIEDIRAFASGEPVRVINPDVLESPRLRGFD